MSLFVCLVYIGGACAFPDQKIGFWRRITWPSAFGEKLAEYAFKTNQDTRES